MAHLAAQQGPDPLMITTVQPKNMTITERNQKLYDLRVKMDNLNAQLAWVKQEIWLTNDNMTVKIVLICSPKCLEMTTDVVHQNCQRV